MDPNLLTTNQAVDPVFLFIFAICLVLLLGITVVMVWFAFRYRRSRNPEPTSSADGNLWLEIIWAVVPTILVLAMFYYGWSGYLALRNVPKNALPVTATARMWSWSFRYANNKTSSKLYVPVGRPVLVNLVSLDVLHGFYLPAFRVKRDVVPGMKNHAWFVASKAGSYDLFCSQYCGVGHSAMVTTVEAVPEQEFTAWLDQQEEGSASTQNGLALLKKYGCLGCHSQDGSKGVGPSFKGLFNSQVQVRKNNVLITLTADEAYLRESIKKPAATVVEGYQAIMPQFPAITDAELDAMVAALKEMH